jgi:ABC-2 type transport system ATP-binding protein
MLACEDLSVHGPEPEAGALAGVTLHVGAGEIAAVVGLPTAGPGTLLRVAAGRLAPAGGTVRVAGRPVWAAVAAGIVGYVRAGAAGPGALTAAEWLHHVSALRGGRRGARAVRVQAALALVGLGREAACRIADLDRDGAEQLAVATLAVGATGLLLLDDCFAGVHAGTRRLLADALADLAMQGRTVLLAPRDVLAVEGLATRVVLLRHGRLLADLRMAEVQRERVAELRLGGGALAGLGGLLAHFPDAVRTGTGVAVPLRGGRTLEGVLAACRAERIPVHGSTVRYRALDDLLAAPARLPDPVRAATLG